MTNNCFSPSIPEVGEVDFNFSTFEIITFGESFQEFKLLGFQIFDVHYSLYASIVTWFCYYIWLSFGPRRYWLFAQETAEITRLEISQNKNHDLVKIFSIGTMVLFPCWCFVLGVFLSHLWLDQIPHKMTKTGILFSILSSQLGIHDCNFSINVYILFFIHDTPISQQWFLLWLFQLLLFTK